MTNEQIIKKANTWLNDLYDQATKKEVKRLIEENGKPLTEAFHKDLEFGTGGLRGIMGVGSNRMNVYTIAMTTQGLANYLIKTFGDLPMIKIAIAYDSRNNSLLFSKKTAEVLSANGIKVYLFSSPRPTPELSFIVRHFKCKAGVVITASHNPKEYNGYKIYWEDGAQIISPHDQKMIQAIKAVNHFSKVKKNPQAQLIETIGEKEDAIYFEKIASLPLLPDLIKKHKDLKILYTPLHGTGIKIVPVCLKKIGFENISIVKSQEASDGNFPNAKSLNPEEIFALEEAIKQAKSENPDLILATDPDTDRMGVVTKDLNQNYKLLNGNQIACIMTYYLLSIFKEKNDLNGKQYLVNTIVTTNLIQQIAKSFNVEIVRVLTGFKYIADMIKKRENTHQFIMGAEESHGYLIDDFVRDKDAVGACCVISEIVCWAKENNKTLFGLLLEIYQKYDYYLETLIPITLKGIDGLHLIQEKMKSIRENPIKTFNEIPVVIIKDYLKKESYHLITKKKTPIDLPKSNVMQFILEDESIVSVRPSGTEPKIKFYISVKAPLTNPNQYNIVTKNLTQKINAITKDLPIPKN